jgi:hypothetical protein
MGPSDLQLYVQSVPITTNVLSSNPVHIVMSSIQHYVIKFVSDLRQVSGTPVSSTNETDCHDITAILLKVALNTINQAKSKLVLITSIADILLI